MSALLQNAIDSLKVGTEFFVSKGGTTAHKHAILLIFNSIELLLKEYLYRIHPILIYRNIDKKISDDAPTAGFDQMLTRLGNVGFKIRASEASAIRNLQRRRNRIEHHRYDVDESDGLIIGESLKFIEFFLAEYLKADLSGYLAPKQFRQVR